MPEDAGSQRGLDAKISSGVERRRSRRESRERRKSSRDSKKLQRKSEKQRAYSFSPGREDTIQIAHSLNAPPVPPIPLDIKDKDRAATEKRGIFGSIAKKTQRASTQPPEDTNWERVPTLHKRAGADLPRRKSSKRRKEEHVREAEIKAMVAVMPTRAATDAYTSGRLVKKRQSVKQRDGSNISLPSADSIHSSLSGPEEHQASFKISAFEVLAPRPTIRYAENPRYPGPKSFGPSRSRSRKRKVSERIAPTEDILKAHKRVDDLADDLDASELRELMERDRKRREKKKIADKIKLERRLARRQRKQEEEEGNAARNGTPPPVNMERGVFGRDVLGATSGNSAVVTSSKRRGSTGSQNGRAKRPADLFRDDSKPNFERTASLQTDGEEPIVAVAQAGTVGKANISPPPSPNPRTHQRGASSISQMMDLVKVEESTSAPTGASTTQPIPIPKASIGRSRPGGTRGASWTSFFKRNNRPKLDTTPSSFSNISRDSLRNAAGPEKTYVPMRATSNLPKRTMSKFREDLPELPLSPPDSRVQSPETDSVPPIREYPEKKAIQRSSTDDQHQRFDTPISGVRSLEMARTHNDTPTSGNRSIEAHSPSPEPTAILSQSMASVDSEGSWLTGRKGGSKRGSAQIPVHPLHESASSLNKRYQDYSDSGEELGIAEDQYFSRLTDDPSRSHRQSNTIPSSDDEDEGGSVHSPSSQNTKWGKVARTPTVIHHTPRAKSREGLLNNFDVESGSGSADSELVGETPPSMKRTSYGFGDQAEGDGLQRATSIDLGKGGHVRRVSAGSARLLDLKRGSGERGVSSN